jgi:protein-S-isoprenylcysteine O-methyltransferase Ste14
LLPGLKPSRGYIVLVAFWRWLKEVRAYLSGFTRNPELRVTPFSKQEKNSMLFLLLKFIYLPMMIQFLLCNWHDLQGKIWLLRGVSPLLTLKCLNLVFFPLFIDIFFIVECGLYAFGYAVESGLLKNEVKSVEPTILGWAVALFCYPPFNGFINTYVSWYTSDDPVFVGERMTLIFKCAVLLCFLVYLWGAISLGTKCSNLTNRGIVTRGAFAYVRHPAYVAKNLAWWLCLVPALSVPGLAVPAVLSMAFWSFLYYLRAITEERHLINDPEYQEYCKKVPWRFIPYVY